MKKRNILFGLILLTFLGACQKKYNCKSFNSELTSETLSVSDFDKIELEMDADIIYMQGTEQSVIIEAPEKLLEHISTGVFGTTLKIELDKNFCFTNKQSVHIYITTAELSEIKISGSGNFKVNNHLSTDLLKLKISGSGDFYADSLTANSFNASISGSGDIYAAGPDTMASQSIKVSGSGDIDLLNIPCQETTITISGSGNCKTNSTDKLDVKISGSGDVRYLGNPSVNSEITGSGSVKQY